MPSVCFYFQVHQPVRLRHYPFFLIGHNHEYEDERANAEIMRKVAAKCYLPTNRTLRDLIRRYDGRFKVAFSITGVAIEQMQRYSPETLASFQELVATGGAEILGETYYHSLAAVFDENEFREQVAEHSALMRSLFGVQPRVFRNTELIYRDRIGELAGEMGFDAVIAEGADDILDWRSPDFVYNVNGHDTRLLLKNYRLSDDVAFRFSNRSWEEFPLTAPKYAGWIHRVSGNGDTVNLFMDYETFGEHQWEATGIFDFLRALPGEVLAHPDWDFKTPGEVVATYPSRGDMPFGRYVSWADIGRDLSAWYGNNMQNAALSQIYELGDAARARNNPAVLEAWRRLQTSDHFYYMSTKWFGDGDVHAYFSHYRSPYDAFINYMNVLSDFREHVLGVRLPAAAAG